MLWLQKNDVDLPRNGADVYGPWVVSDTVVKGMYSAVSGYKVADGKPKWTLKLPADMCAAPAEDGRRQDRRRVHERHHRQGQVQPSSS